MKSCVGTSIDCGLCCTYPGCGLEAYWLDLFLSDKTMGDLRVTLTLFMSFLLCTTMHMLDYAGICELVCW